MQSLQPREGAFHHARKEDKPWANTQLWPFQGVRSGSPAVFERKEDLNRGIWRNHLSWQIHHSTYPRQELCTSSWTLGGIHWSISDATNRQNLLKSYSSLLTPTLLPCCSVNMWWSPTSFQEASSSLINVHEVNIKPNSVTSQNCPRKLQACSRQCLDGFMCVYIFLYNSAKQVFSHTCHTSLKQGVGFLLIHINTSKWKYYQVFSAPLFLGWNKFYLTAI